MSSCSCIASARRATSAAREAVGVGAAHESGPVAEEVFRALRLAGFGADRLPATTGDPPAAAPAAGTFAVVCDVDASRPAIAEGSGLAAGPGAGAGAGAVGAGRRTLPSGTALH